MTTPTLARCELTELLTDQCAHCRGLADPQPLRTLGRPIAARYEGYCRACRSPYGEGDTIQRVADDDGTGYLGPCCVEVDGRG